MLCYSFKKTPALKKAHFYPSVCISTRRQHWPRLSMINCWNPAEMKTSSDPPGNEHITTNDTCGNERCVQNWSTPRNVLPHILQSSSSSGEFYIPTWGQTAKGCFSPGWGGINLPVFYRLKILIQLLHRKGWEVALEKLRIKPEPMPTGKLFSFHCASV